MTSRFVRIDADTILEYDPAQVRRDADTGDQRIFAKRINERFLRDELARLQPELTDLQTIQGSDNLKRRWGVDNFDIVNNARIQALISRIAELEDLLGRLPS